MKKYILGFIIVWGVLIGQNCFAALQDYYNTGADDAGSVYGGYFRGQSFTTNQEYTLTSIKIGAYSIGNEVDCVLDVYLADVDDKPTGSVLTTANFHNTDFAGHTSYPPPSGNWVDIDVTDYLLADVTKYVLVLSCPLGNINDKLGYYVDTDSSGGGYSGGMWVYSNDSGSTWTTNSAFDAMFETYGDVPAVALDMNYVRAIIILGIFILLLIDFLVDLSHQKHDDMA